MQASELKCPTCGSPPRDVDPSYTIEVRSAVAWTCENGHRQISGWRKADGFLGKLAPAWTFTHLPLKDE